MDCKETDNVNTSVKKLVLVVEDESLTSEWIIMELSKRGLEPVLACDFHAAYGLLASTTFLAVVLDIMIPPGEEPGMNTEQSATVDSNCGLNLFRCIREGAFEQKATQRDIPVFVVTCVTLRNTPEHIQSLETIEALKPVQIFRKPLHLGDVAEFVKLHLERTP